MIIFDVLTDDSPVGWKGERTRLFLTEAGYQKSLENQEKGPVSYTHLEHNCNFMVSVSMEVEKLPKDVLSYVQK